MSLTLEFKQTLHSHCQSLLEQRIAALNAEIASTQEAQANETKSSAGDKYETGREMMQREKAKNMAQLNEATKLLQTFNRLTPTKVSESIASGTLVKTNKGQFYIAVPIGKVQLDSEDWFVLSSVSPIGKALMGLKTGESLSFNGREYSIEEIL